VVDLFILLEIYCSYEREQQGLAC